MPMKIISTALPDVLLIKPEVYRDDRGFFTETYHQGRYIEGEINSVFIQDNHSRSQRGTLRGLHYQLHHAQCKLIYVVTGEIFDVAVDIRRGSPTFGQWVGICLSNDNKHQIYIPAGYAHGFCVLSETADVIYKCSDLYDRDDEHGIYWADPSVNIDWPISDPILSEKDDQNPELRKLPEYLLPVFNL